LNQKIENTDFGDLMILLFGKINLNIGENKVYNNFNFYSIEVINKDFDLVE
jgi:hypothetical protein